jgi:hypothetical protein
LTPETILSRSPKATYEVVAGEAILIHLDTGAYFSLNSIGTEFWQMLDGQQTIHDHATTLANKYGVDVPMVVADLLELAHKMTPEDLVVSSGQ